MKTGTSGRPVATRRRQHRVVGQPQVAAEPQDQRRVGHSVFRSGYV